eukprot:52690-Amphidinium_carterae.1
MAAMGRRPFIDTDNLRNLDKLFDAVATQTQTLCVLCTRFIFTRPWCVGEMVTAVSWKVKIARVIGSDFSEPDEQFINGYEQHMDDIASLTNCGMDVLKIQETLRSVIQVEGVALPLAPSPGNMHSLCEMMLRKTPKNFKSQRTESSCFSSSSKPPAQRDLSSRAMVVMVADMSNTEAACTGYLLSQMIAGRIDDVTRIPILLTDSWGRA